MQQEDNLKANSANKIYHKGPIKKNKLKCPS